MALRKGKGTKPNKEWGEGAPVKQFLKGKRKFINP